MDVLADAAERGADVFERGHVPNGLAAGRGVERKAPPPFSVVDQAPRELDAVPDAELVEDRLQVALHGL